MAFESSEQAKSLLERESKYHGFTTRNLVFSLLRCRYPIC